MADKLIVVLHSMAGTEEEPYGIVRLIPITRFMFSFSDANEYVDYLLQDDSNPHECDVLSHDIEDLVFRIKEAQKEDGSFNHVHLATVKYTKYIEDYKTKEEQDREDDD